MSEEDIEALGGYHDILHKNGCSHMLNVHKIPYKCR